MEPKPENNIERSSKVINKVIDTVRGISELRPDAQSPVTNDRRKVLQNHFIEIAAFLAENHELPETPSSLGEILSLFIQKLPKNDPTLTPLREKLNKYTNIEQPPDWDVVAHELVYTGEKHPIYQASTLAFASLSQESKQEIASLYLSSS